MCRSVGGLNEAAQRSSAVRNTNECVTNGAMADPVLELHDGSGALLQMNDNWRDTQETEIEATGIPPTDDRESAIANDGTSSLADRT